MKQEKPGPRGCAVSRHGEREGGGEGGGGRERGWPGLRGLPWAGWLGGPTVEVTGGDVGTKASRAQSLRYGGWGGGSGSRSPAALGVTVNAVGKHGEDRRGGRAEDLGPSWTDSGISQSHR